jgi:tRNA dimethylallyltransferase
MRAVGDARHNLLVVLGPTACGKTRLAVALARRVGGEILSADSRQVYRGLDLGSGKDHAEYGREGDPARPPVPVHLIDIVDLSEEYNLYRYQRDFLAAFADVTRRGRLPILAGGSGMYLEAVLRGYRMPEAPPDPILRAELDGLDMEGLRRRLAAVKKLHNTTDFGSRERLIRAIEIAEAARREPPTPLPDLNPLILGVRVERVARKARILARLEARLEAGMLEEVQGLLRGGVSPERLESLGLEYRYLPRYLRGEIPGREELVRSLGQAIYVFSKRQESWFARLERAGLRIHWIEGPEVEAAAAVLREAGVLAAD